MEKFCSEGQLLTPLTSKAMPVIFPAIPPAAESSDALIII
jgi:hypothetical protein